jgi:hypothetical protein
VIATQAWYSIGPVTEVACVASNGMTKALSGAGLKAPENEYTHGASRIGPVGRTSSSSFGPRSW